MSDTNPFVLTTLSKSGEGRRKWEAEVRAPNRTVIFSDSSRLKFVISWKARVAAASLAERLGWGWRNVVRTSAKVPMPGSRGIIRVIEKVDDD